MQENRIRSHKPEAEGDESKTSMLYKARKKFALLRILNESKEHSNLYHSVLLNVERGHQSRSSIASRQCDQSPNGCQGKGEDIKKSSTQLDESAGGQTANPGPNLPRCVILHYSPFKAIWDWITLILVLYIALATPYFAAFHSTTSSITQVQDSSRRSSDSFEYSTNGSQQTYLVTVDTRPSKFSKRGSINILVIVDLVVDIMFLADILINFRTTYLSDGEVVTEPGKIAINYIKGWFFIDALAAIPFDLLLFRVPTDRVTLTGVLKAARLLRLLRVARRIDQYSEYGAAVLILLMGTFVLISHWLACIFYAIAYYERLMPDALPIGWLDGLANKTGMPYMANDSLSGPDTGTSYITSLYFTFTILTSVGFGNVAAVTNSEKVFTIIAMLVGSLLSAAIFGNVSSIMLRLYQGTEEYLEMQTRIKEFIRFHQIPKTLADRLIESFQHSRSFAHGIDMNSVLKGFPECLQADICLHLNRVLLSNCEAFAGASQGCLRALSVKFKSTHCPPGDTLVHPGDIIESMYFIARGTIEVVADDIIMAILGKGDIIGDDSIFSSDVSFYAESKTLLVAKSSYSVRAISYCDLHTITVAELRSILEAYPEFAGKFVQNFRVTFNLRKDDKEFRPNTLERSVKKLIGQEKAAKKKHAPLTAQERIASMRRAFSTKGPSSGMEPVTKEIPEEDAGSKGSIVILSPYGASIPPTDEDFRPFHASASLNCTSSTKSKTSNKKTHSASDIASWSTSTHRPQITKKLEVEPSHLTILYANGSISHTISTPYPIIPPAQILTSCALQSSQNGKVFSANEILSSKREILTSQHANINSGSKSFDDQLSSRDTDASTFLNIIESSKGKSASCGEPQTFFGSHSVQQQASIKDASLTVHQSTSHFSNFYSNDIPQPLKNINDRLREINRRMWAFEKNLFTAVDKILEMLNAQPHLFSTLPTNATQPPVDLSP